MHANLQRESLASGARFAHHKFRSTQRIATDRQQLIFLADLNVPKEWLVYAVGVAATVFLLFRGRSKAKKDPLARSPDTASLAQQRSVERQMQNLLVELSEMARQITAGLDTRAARLDALIREADEKIAALSALQNAVNMGQQAAPEASMAVAPPLLPPPPAPCPYEPDPRHAEVYNLADQGQSPGQIAGQLKRPNGEIELILALRPRKTG